MISYHIFCLADLDLNIAREFVIVILILFMCLSTYSHTHSGHTTSFMLGSSLHPGPIAVNPSLEMLNSVLLDFCPRTHPHHFLILILIKSFNLS